VKLVLDNGTSLPAPTTAIIVKTLQFLGYPGISAATLIRDGGEYLQARVIGRLEFELRYGKDSTQRQARASRMLLNQDEVIAAFVSFAAGETEWSSARDWEAVAVESGVEHPASKPHASEQPVSLVKGMSNPQRRNINRNVLLLVLAAVAILLFLLSSLDDNSGGSSSLPVSAQRKMYYDIIATQDLNPDSNEWNEDVKESAAEHYEITIDEVNEIIHRGATEGWLQPEPP